MNGGKIFRISIKVIAWIIGIFLLLFTAVWIVLKVPRVQNYMVSKLTSFVEKKTHTRVELHYINIGFPKSIILEGVFLEDKRHDTLLSLSALEIDVNMLALLNRTVSVQSLTLNNPTIHLVRNARDSSFNFQFLIDAFTKPGDKKEEVVTDTSASDPWRIKANHVTLTNAIFRMNDSLSGLQVAVSAGHIGASLKALDLESSTIAIGDITLANAHTTVFTTLRTPEDTSSSSGGWNGISVSSVSIENSTFSYNDLVSPMFIQTLVGKLELEESVVDLSKQVIKSKGLFLANSTSLIEMKKEETTPEKRQEPADATTGNWQVEVASLEMEKNSFQMDIRNAKHLPAGIDWNHLHLTGINSSISTIFYNGPDIRANIASLSAQDKSGLGIRSLRGEASLTATSASLKELDLVTNHSHIGQTIQITFSSLSEIMSSLALECRMRDNHFALRELLLLVPDLDTVEILRKNKDRVVDFTLEANGSLKQLNISRLAVQTMQTIVQANGVIKSVTEPEHLWMDLRLSKIQTGAADIAALLPDSTLPSGIHLPDTLSVNGAFKGSLSDFETALFLASSSGNADLKASLKELGKEVPLYSITLNTHAFNLGKLLGTTNLGKMTGAAEVNGKGLDTSSMAAKFKTAIEGIEINGYNFKSIRLEGGIDTTLLTAQGAVNDSNLILTLDTKVNLSKSQEMYDLKLNLKGVDFYGLGYTKDRINLSAFTNVYLNGDPTKKIDGHATVQNILVVKNGKRYKADSLVLISVNEKGRSSMKLNSSMIGANFEGNLDLLSVGPAITNHINRYFQYSETNYKKTNPQDFTFEFQLNDSPLLREVIFPSLKEYNPLHIKGAFDSEQSKLAINAEIPFATYDGLTISGLRLTVNSDTNKLDYSTSWDYVKTSAITIQNTTLNGKIAQDSITINLQVKNEKMAEKILLHSYLRKATDNHYRFSILPNGLSIQGKSWLVSEQNYIEFGPRYLFAEQFKFTQDNQMLHLQSSAEGKDMALRFSSYDLHSLSQIVEEDEVLVQGILEGDIQLKNFMHNPAFTSDLKIKDLSFRKSRVGNLHITADNLTEERYTAKVVLTDSINKATISGYYLTSGKDALHFNANLETIELASVDAFSMGQISSSNGYIKGNIAITGAVNAPKFNGEVSLVDASTKVAYINQRISMKKETITISNDKVSFNSFKITDSLNNEALINGYVGIESFSDLAFHLNVSTKEFMVLNTTAINNKLYYGKIILNSTISIRGNQDLPVINADVNIVRGSHFTFAIPDSKISIDQGDGVVVFTSDSSSLDPLMLRQQEVISDKITGLDITANISINRNSVLSILVDPISGDSLSLRGDADLNFRMDATGQIGLNGRYIVAEGSYKASLENLLVRRFKIVSGSTIIWNGEPLEALIDISATYSIKTAPEGLLANSPGVDSSAMRKPLPFTVIMMMKGELLKPIISFRLDMPDNAKGAVGGEVYSKISEINANESEVNKQVFALLILNRFIAPDNSTSGGSSSFARRSVSRMMSNELNKLSSKYVNGLQIDVDIQSYNDINNGQQQGNTQVEVGVTKSLLNERMSVQVGTNVMLEGQNGTTNSNTQNFTGDVVVEYKLTKSGRYKVKAFRTNQYDGISNGTIVQTGVGLAYTRNFTHVNELFTSRKKRKKNNSTK